MCIFEIRGRDVVMTQKIFMRKLHAEYGQLIFFQFTVTFKVE